MNETKKTNNRIRWICLGCEGDFYEMESETESMSLEQRKVCPLCHEKKGFVMHIDQGLQ